MQQIGIPTLSRSSRQWISLILHCSFAVHLFWLKSCPTIFEFLLILKTVWSANSSSWDICHIYMKQSKECFTNLSKGIASFINCVIYSFEVGSLFGYIMKHIAVYHMNRFGEHVPFIGYVFPIWTQDWCTYENMSIEL